VTAELEEVVADADPIDAEQLLPEARERPLDLSRGATYEVSEPGRANAVFGALSARGAERIFSTSTGRSSDDTNTCARWAAEQPVERLHALGGPDAELVGAPEDAPGGGEVTGLGVRVRAAAQPRRPRARA
jgi:hypothetical protein